MNDPVDTYKQHYLSFLRRVAENLEELMVNHTAGMPRIDQITARAKDPESFANKATQTEKDGSLKYENPLTEIQDQIGARVVVFYKADVDRVLTVIHEYFQAIEEQELVPESVWEFGYFGTHLVLALPKDVIPADVAVFEVPRFFELQIKTLFQHAWSEADHDLGYKSQVTLSRDQNRRLAFTAAQAWGADHIFGALNSELSSQ